MPPYKMLTKDTLKEIFTGIKKLMKLKIVEFIKVPKYDEISVKNLYDKLIALDGMVEYFPSSYPKGR